MTITMLAKIAAPSARCRPSLLASGPWVQSLRRCRMSPADFLNTSVSFSNPAQRQGSLLAGMLSALAASLEAVGGNIVFQLDPWDDLAAARAWTNLAGPRTLVLPRAQSDQASPARILAVTGLPGRALADGAIVPTRAIADFVRVADLKQVVLVDISRPG